jgi:hypothetical protein
MLRSDIKSYAAQKEARDDLRSKSQYKFAHDESALQLDGRLGAQEKVYPYVRNP